MHTEVRVRTQWKKMEELFDTLGNDSDIMIKSFNLVKDLSENEYDKEEKYTYDVNIRHQEGVDPKKELQKALDTL